MEAVFLLLSAPIHTATGALVLFLAAPLSATAATPSQITRCPTALQHQQQTPTEAAFHFLLVLTLTAEAQQPVVLFLATL